MSLNLPRFAPGGGGGGKSAAPAPKGGLNLPGFAPAAPAAPVAPAPAPAVSNLGGAPLLAPGVSTPSQLPASTAPIAPSAAFGSPVPVKTLGTINLPPTVTGPAAKSNLPGGTGSVIRQATPAEAAAFPSPSPAETIKNAEAAQEKLANEADQYYQTGEGPVPLKGQENYAPGQPEYLPGGGVTRVGKSTPDNIVKGLVEFPEHAWNTVKDTVAALTGHANDVAATSSHERVRSVYGAMLPTYQAAIENGQSPARATAAAMLGAAGAGILDATMLEAVFGPGVNAIVKSATPDLEHIAAWQLLDKPATAAEAEANFRSLAQEFHPDKAGGSASVMAKLNDARAVIAEKGIPTNVQTTLNDIFSRFKPEMDNAESVIEKARAGNVKPTLALPAAGETSVEAVKPPEPVAPAEVTPPVETPAAAPVVAQPEAPAFTPKAPLSPVTSPTVDLAPKGTVQDIIPPKPSMADTVISKLSEPKITPVQDIMPPKPSTLADKAHELTMQNGGTTITLDGSVPTKGIAYAPSKDTEFSIEKEKFTPDLIDQYATTHAAALSQPGNHLGLWEDNGKVYLDISQVGPNTKETLEKAQNAQQLAAFDLKTHQTIPLGTMENGVYNKVNGKTSNSIDLNSRKAPVASSNGGKIGVSKVSNNLSKVSRNSKPNSNEGGSSIQRTSEKPAVIEQPAVEKAPVSEGEGVSKIGKSIEQKAIDAGSSPGFSDTAKYQKMNVKEQFANAAELIKGNFENARAIIRGTEPLPEGMKGTALIDEMEKYIKENPSSELSYELANSPLVTATSEAAQEMRLMAEREPDSAMAKIKELKDAMIKKAGGTEVVSKARTQIKKEIKASVEKINLPKEELSWDRFLSSIEC